ncbi:c-type cytochrome [Pedobacter xixiisoli]|uniref:Quinol:cytochrome c oxidoreductase pentaheme cytochrome subunit n=1 Tax=Pedobacter xixiisoli TaxID=1476464 RepID=A0A286AEW3_9SPHI|nr:c-type cytochrome [Pedobacter xixiisoli]SOD20438.1 quinol:cytochrome c oxidoreductase pentaheme cytochrome subunit [Pedobacter xixiisoli]
MRNISFGLKKFRKATFLLAVLSFLIVNVSKAQDVAEGRTLFKSKCASCHALDHDGTGPALTPKVNSLEESYLIPWIRNNVELRASGNAQAIEAAKFSPSEMTAFPTLTDDQIKNIIAYAKEGEPKKAEDPTLTGVKDEGVSGLSIAGVIAIIVLSIVVLVVLGRAVKMLERLILEKQGIDIVEEENVSLVAGVKGLFKNKKFVFFTVLCLVMVLGSFGWMGMWETGVHTGYQPTQPIKFSHELHAGINQIDCQYCHTGAFKSKNSTIPSLNVCMNCHKNVQARTDDGLISPEIQKIYNALGYNPDTQTYDKTKEKPVEWVRVHNLPDFAYFNHSQHVVVGEEAIRKEAGLKPTDPVCFACHGPVNTMEEVYQYSPLTMKWCINCHKDADISGKKNDAFYANVIAAHEKIKKGEKITPALLGGLECGKCHY